MREINSYFSPYSCVSSSYEILATKKSDMTTRVISFTGSREIVFCLKGQARVTMAIPDSEAQPTDVLRDNRTNTSYLSTTLREPISVGLTEGGISLVPSQWVHTIELSSNSIVLIARYRCFTNTIANCPELSEDLWQRYKPRDPNQKYFQ